MPQELGLDGAGLEEAHRPAATVGGLDGMRTQNAERIGVARGEDGIDAVAGRVGGRSFCRSRVRLRHGSILSKVRPWHHRARKGGIARGMHEMAFAKELAGPIRLELQCPESSEREGSVVSGAQRGKSRWGESPGWGWC